MLGRVDCYIFLEYHLPVDAVQCRRGLESFNSNLFFIRIYVRILSLFVALAHKIFHKTFLIRAGVIEGNSV